MRRVRIRTRAHFLSCWVLPVDDRLGWHDHWGHTLRFFGFLILVSRAAAEEEPREKTGLWWKRRGGGEEAAVFQSKSARASALHRTVHVSRLCFCCSSLSILLFRHFLMYNCSRKDSFSTKCNRSEFRMSFIFSLPGFFTHVYMQVLERIRKTIKNQVVVLLSSTCFPPERGLGGPAAEESSPSLRPLHWRQGGRQQLRRGVHHWNADAHAPTRASCTLPQRPGQLPGLWLRLWPLLVGLGSFADLVVWHLFPELNDSPPIVCLPLNTLWMSAERPEAVGPRLARLCRSRTERWNESRNEIFYQKRRKNVSHPPHHPPPPSLYNTPLTCVSCRHLPLRCLFPSCRVSV